jgi:hypothetical protein
VVLALQEHARLDCNGVPGTRALAYSAASSATEERKFLTLALDGRCEVTAAEVPLQDEGLNLGRAISYFCGFFIIQNCVTPSGYSQNFLRSF